MTRLVSLLSVANMLTLVCKWYLLSLSIGLTVPIGYFFVFIPLVITARVLPVSVAGIGVADAAWVVLFQIAGLSIEQALSLSFMHYGTNLIVALMGGAAFVMGGSRTL